MGSPLAGLETVDGLGTFACLLHAGVPILLRALPLQSARLPDSLRPYSFLGQIGRDSPTDALRLGGAVLCLQRLEACEQFRRNEQRDSMHGDVNVCL